MNIPVQIEEYLTNLAETSRNDMQNLHHRILSIARASQLWFLDGRDGNGKIVSNPSVGYGLQKISYADGRTREFYRVGISANTTGVSVYIMGIKDKTYLARTYAAQIGKAKVTGYCIKFRKLRDLNIEVLEAAIRDGLGTQRS
jgi:hypothetical protein